MPGLEANKKLVKLLRDTVADFKADILRECSASGAEAEETKDNFFDFYIHDEATELANGNESGARKLFVKYVDELLASAKPASTGPARYEFKSGTSNKFWQIELAGASFTVTFGKIGTAGTSQVKKWKDAATAKKEHDKLVAEKTKKGYKLVAAKGGAAKKPAKTPKRRRP